MIDYFVAPLRCARCGRVSSADRSTNMSTHLRIEADNSSLPVGSRLAIDLAHVADSGYLPLAPADGAELRLLETWDCPACGALNWAEVKITAGVISTIEAVELTRSRLLGAHFISDEVEPIAARLVGRSALELQREGADLVAILKERLP
jgi:hypothetical protein